jgi:hypothetical protein
LVGDGVEKRDMMGPLFYFVLSCSTSKFNDSPEIWNKVYGVEQPQTIQIIHSHLWESGHFSLEYSFHFESSSNEDLEMGLIQVNELNQRPSGEGKDSYGVDTPSWFAPKGIGHYTLWRTPVQSSKDFLLLIDNDTQHLFWTETQL